MFGRKLYKTKLCLLFQRGRCPRQSCNFAHGEAELRRFGGSLSGRHDFQSADLRDKLDRRYSPHRRVSPSRVARAQHPFRYRKPISHDKGSSFSRSPSRRSIRRYSDRRRSKKQRTDGGSDLSESFKASDGSVDRKKGGKDPSYDDKDDLEEQLKQLHLDIEMLDDHKSQLEGLLDEKINEAHKLSTRIEDLESQLKKEQEDCKRLISSKIKRFIKAHGRYIKAQEELKRSQTRLQKIGDQLISDTLKLNAYDDDPNVNIISDGEPNANGNSRKREMTFRAGKSQRFEGPAPLPETTIKKIEMMKAILKRNKSSVEDYNHKQGSNASNILSLDKGKGLEVRHTLPLTGMAAHAVDDLLEANEFDEKSEAAETTAVNESDDAKHATKTAYIHPPPPPTAQNAYKQYDGDDEEVDVEKVDSEMLDIDINSEVDIEQLGENIQMILECNFIRNISEGVRIEGNSITFYKYLTTIEMFPFTTATAAIEELELEENEYLQIQEMMHFNQETPYNRIQERFKEILTQLKAQGYIGDDPMKHWAKNKVLCELEIKNKNFIIEDRPLKHLTPKEKEAFQSI